jgi:broad specificity phosphatase PhoE
MAGKIHIVRHAESKHNVDKNFHQLDPELTDLGQHQSEELGRTFPHSQKIGLILTSPLRRAIQTTLFAFSDILDERYVQKQTAKGDHEGARLILVPEAQERSDLPCDTGSDRPTLEEAFPQLDFADLPEEWRVKKGFYAADDDAVVKRSDRVRSYLAELIEGLAGTDKSDIVLVTHGVFMKFLTGDPSIDLPKAGFSTVVVKKEEGSDWVLVPA